MNRADPLPLASDSRRWGVRWGRPLVLVLGVLNLFNLPIGTAVGIYTLWALLSDASDSPPRIPGLASVAIAPAVR